MIILALDLAQRKTGWCLGEAGANPKTGVLKLKEDRAEDATEQFALWLHELFGREKVELLTVERYLPAGALKGATTSNTRDGAIMLNAAARAVAAIHRVPFRSPAPATVRVHFIQRASMGDSASTKAAVLKMAILLGLLPRDCVDFDQADAVALWDFSCSHFANRATSFALT